MSAVTASAWRPSRRDLAFWALVFNTELLLVIAHLWLGNVTVTQPRYILYGLAWVTVSLWVFRHVDTPDTDERTHRRALLLACGYFLILGVTGGVFVFTAFGPFGHTHGLSVDALRVAWLPPGWGPALLYHGTFFEVILMPARLFGYLALSYLVYVTILDAANVAVPGFIGLFSCTSCTWPVLASVVTGLFGASTAIASTVTVLSLDVSTAVFLLTVGMLSWRPLLR